MLQYLIPEIPSTLILHRCGPQSVLAVGNNTHPQTGWHFLFSVFLEVMQTICILFLLMWHKDPSVYRCKWQLHDPQRVNPTVLVFLYLLFLSESVVKFPQWLYYILQRFDSRVIFRLCIIIVQLMPFLLHLLCFSALMFAWRFVFVQLSH